uniref:Beta-lactamase-related domain-containing protein n=1 Tax=Biomphalaria glabrata TaxID=6526 RepID=A0A2C9LNL5_BIOGL
MNRITTIISLLIGLLAWQYYTHNVPSTNETPRTSGYFHPAFRKVAEVFRENLKSGLERGASFAAYHKGQCLIDLYGGWSDHEVERHWQDNTLTISWSMVKGVAAVVIARLVDMGLLDYKTEVYKYWPEFEKNDKQNITVEMLMAHQAGLIGLDERLHLFDYRDNWTKVERLLAQQKPKWPAVCDFLYAFFLANNFNSNLKPLKLMTIPEYANIGFPSISGFGSARSLAKLYDYLANKGSVKAKRLLSPNAVDLLLTPLNASTPNVFLLGIPMTRGLMVYTDGKGRHLIGHPGYGGNMAFADPEQNVGVAYFTNYLGGYRIDDPREVTLRETFYECFKDYKKSSPPIRSV